MPRRFAYALLVAATAARLLMQVAAMPPYAGLDELYHVARLAFVLQEHRNPTAGEASIPPYLEATLERRADAVPSFALLQRDWSSGIVVRDRALGAHDFRPYARRNYEAQQPSLYYSLMAPLARLAPRTALDELRVWRAASLLFALLTIVAVAAIGERWWGGSGLVAAALLAAIPTWETLVVRAGNDAFACMLVAVALAITAAAPRRALFVAAEAVVWALAIASKLYTWPLAVALPFFWYWQRASRWRIVAVSAACVAAAVLTMAELASRTGTAIGVAFAHPAVPVPASLSVVELVKITIASAAWTSGEHWDALRPLGMALYLLPIAVAIVIAARRSDLLFLSAAVLAAFALAQSVNVIESVRAGGLIGGKEGWYWFVLGPVLVPALLAPAVRRLPWIAWWIVAWDVVITDAQLFHTWAGELSPAHPSFLFRWGPLRAPRLGLWTTTLRLAHLASFALLQRSARDA